MSATAHQRTPPSRSALIPPELVVRDRLHAVCKEARLLRRLLALSRQAARSAPDAIAPADHSGTQGGRQ